MVQSPHALFPRRWAARTVDWVLLLVLTSPLWVLTILHLKHEAALETAYVAGKSGWQLLFGRWDADGVTDELADLWSTVALSVALTVLAQVLLMAAYEAVLLRIFGRTIGKAVFLLVVESPEGRPAFKRIVPRTLVAVVLPGAGWAVICAGVVWLSLPLVLVGMCLLLLSAVECIACWHDKKTRTRVVPVKLRRP